MMTDPFLEMLDPDPTRAEAACQRLSHRLVFKFQHDLSSEAEDLAQQALVRVLERLEDVKNKNTSMGSEDLIRFTFGVAKKLALEGIRRRQASGRFEDLSPDSDHDDRISSRASSPMEDLLSKEKWAGVKICLNILVPQDRDLLLCWYLDEKTAHKDLAARIRTTDNGLRIRIHRILKLVRQCVAKKGGETAKRNVPRRGGISGGDAKNA